MNLNQYFSPRFTIADVDYELPEEFAILSAHFADAGSPAHAELEDAHDALEETLIDRNQWVTQVSCIRPDSDDPVSACVAALPPDEALALARQFGARIFYHVNGDALHLVSCDGSTGLQLLGAFREHLSLVAHVPRQRLSPAADSPWRGLTSDGLNRAISPHLMEDPSAMPASGRVFAPREGITLGTALVDALPSEDVRKQAIEDLGYEHVFPGDVERRLPQARDARWVVECEVTDSMVSGCWGISQLIIGERGYLLEEPDWGATDETSSRILGAWEPSDDEQARLECILSTYARVWDEIGLPPRLGQWVEGEPGMLLAGVCRTVKENPTEWAEISRWVRSADGFQHGNPDNLTEVSQVFGIPLPLLDRTIGIVGAPDFARRVNAGLVAVEEREAAVALYLACIIQRLVPETDGDRHRSLGPVEQLCGTWSIGYAGADGLIAEEESQQHLEFLPDGSFRWEPGPEWLGSSGTWGVETTADGDPKLYLEAGWDTRYSHYLVFHDDPMLGRAFHWQRTRADAVVFSDRILRGMWVTGLHSRT